MSKYITCPECKDKIFSLSYRATKKVSWGGSATPKTEHTIKDNNESLFLVHEQDYCSEDQPDVEDEPDIEYRCVECNGILFRTENEATEYWKDNTEEGEE